MFKLQIKTRLFISMFPKTTFILFTFLLCKFSNGLEEKIPKIAIIGGGIGGTATAYFLKEYYSGNVIIDLYEPGEIGGRLATSKSFNKQYEMGGSIIHSKNFYMNNFIKLFGLNKNKNFPSIAGLFDGSNYAFIESDWSLVNFAKLFWRYGLDIYYLRRRNNEMLDNFSNIYKSQTEGKFYKTVTDLLGSMDPIFPSLLRRTFKDYLLEEGLHPKIIDEFVTAITRTNYGQLTDVHAFVGSVSVAGAGSDLWSVFGGNKRVPEELLKASQANRLKKLVTQVSPTHNGKFRVNSKIWNFERNQDFNDDDDISSEINYEDEQSTLEIYDAVAIATPLTEDKALLKLSNFNESFYFSGYYQKIFSTIVEGRLNKTTFKENRIDEILTYNPFLFYNSVGLQNPVDTKNKNECKSNFTSVYKIFSPQRLTNTQLDYLFQKYTKTEIVEWLAYPHYTDGEIFDKFELIPGLYYNNAIEKAASAMEMSAIAAKNVALLIHNFLNTDHNNNNESFYFDENYSTKDEL